MDGRDLLGVCVCSASLLLRVNDDDGWESLWFGEEGVQEPKAQLRSHLR